MLENLQEQRIRELIAPTVEAMDYRIVRVKMLEQNGQTLQIMAERVSDRALGLEDCEKISREISAIMDVEDPIPGEYNLEVSSPGIDRPLVAQEDFSFYAGQPVKLTAESAVNGRKRFTGELLGIDVDEALIHIRLKENGEHVSVPLAMLSTAKLTTSDLIKA